MNCTEYMLPSRLYIHLRMHHKGTWTKSISYCGYDSWCSAYYGGGDSSRTNRDQDPEALSKLAPTEILLSRHWGDQRARIRGLPAFLFWKRCRCRWFGRLFFFFFTCWATVMLDDSTSLIWSVTACNTFNSVVTFGWTFRRSDSNSLSVKSTFDTMSMMSMPVSLSAVNTLSVSFRCM